MGRYRALSLPVDGAVQEFLSLLYARGSRLYVPASSLHLISRFSGGDETTAPLHQLGSDKWDKAKQKAQKQVRDTAAELLDIYSRRASKQGFACLITMKIISNFVVNSRLRKHLTNYQPLRQCDAYAGLTAHGSLSVWRCGFWKN